MEFLSKDDVLYIHDELISQIGGASGVLNDSLLESAINAAVNIFNYETDDIFEIAAGYIYSINKNHAFKDGNKRTSIASGLIFLENNNISIKATHDELVNLALDIANSKINRNKVAEFLRSKN